MNNCDECDANDECDDGMGKGGYWKGHWRSSQNTPQHQKKGWLKMPEQNSEFYKKFLHLFVNVDYKDIKGIERKAKGILQSVNGTKIFVKGDYNIFFIDMGKIINISGREDRKKVRHY